MTRTTVCIPRDVALQVDDWAKGQGYPHGPGHRTAALVDLVNRGLRQTDPQAKQEVPSDE